MPDLAVKKRHECQSVFRVFRRLVCLLFEYFVKEIFDAATQMALFKVDFM